MTNTVLFLLIGVISLCVVIYILYNYFTNPSQRKGTVFTCSTFFDFKTGDRWDRFCVAIDSLKDHHSKETLAKIDKWIVINEYSDNSTVDWCKKVKERYPFITCIQKGFTEKGQARTMNIILQKIRPYKLWIHWEEAWSVRTGFLDDAFEIMNSDDGRNITQLQFTFHKGTVNWLDVESERIHCKGRLCTIDPSDKTDEFIGQSAYRLRDGTHASWPLYSLLPSINRAEFYSGLGEFDEDPDLWPIKFEWDFARRWYKAGGKKAVLQDGPVWRPGTHISTYE